MKDILTKAQHDALNHYLVDYPERGASFEKILVYVLRSDWDYIQLDSDYDMFNMGMIVKKIKKMASSLA